MCVTSENLTHQGKEMFDYYQYSADLIVGKVETILKIWSVSVYTVLQMIIGN